MSAKKKAVLITGGARRIGKALAIHFARHDYDIALHYHRSKADAARTKKEIEGLGKRCSLFALDLAETKKIPMLMQHVRQVMPHCSVLINNASVFERADFMKTDEALFERQWDVNFKAPFFTTQVFAEIFKKGVVINMLDTVITQNRTSHFAYALSKKALADFTKMAARALAPKILVHGICPGITLPANKADEIYMRKLAERLPFQRLATPDQIAQVAFELCAQQYVTGQIIFVDGGEHLL